MISRLQTSLSAQQEGTPAALLFKPPPTLLSAEIAFLPKTIVYWNNLDNSTVCAQAVERFRSSLLSSSAKRLFLIHAAVDLHLHCLHCLFTFVSSQCYCRCSRLCATCQNSHSSANQPPIQSWQRQPNFRRCRQSAAAYCSIQVNLHTIMCCPQQRAVYIKNPYNNQMIFFFLLCFKKKWCSPHCLEAIIPEVGYCQRSTSG